MTHSLNCNRKKRVNESHDLNEIQDAKRARTKHFDSNEIAGNHCHLVSENNRLDFLRESSDKEHHLSASLNNEFFRSTSVYAQPGMSSVSQEYVAIRENNFNYLPDLSSTENPHYYENNKLLFELYVERLRRSAFHSVSASHHF